DGARRGAEPHGELVRDDRREGRLAEPRRPAEEHVVEHVAACARRLDLDTQVLAHGLLADVLVERPRAERRLDDAVVLELDRRDGTVVTGRHQPASPFNAARITSSSAAPSVRAFVTARSASGRL